MEFVWGEGGSFDMGSNGIDTESDEMPMHRVTLDGVVGDEPDAVGGGVGEQSVRLQWGEFSRGTGELE
jgi:hypothetical protein